MQEFLGFILSGYLNLSRPYLVKFLTDTWIEVVTLNIWNEFEEKYVNEFECLWVGEEESRPKRRIMNDEKRESR